MPEDTIAELFARDPFDYAKQDIDRIIEHYQQARKQFNLTGKAAGPAEKPKIDLKELGLASIFALLLAFSPARADPNRDSGPGTYNFEFIKPTFPPEDYAALTLSESTGIIFEMHGNACLRGPLKFFDRGGKIAFSLEADEYYPKGCAK